ncbi:MAG: DUF1801 domain-containing protein [Phycisphaerales bacterium]
MRLPPDILAYLADLSAGDRAICRALAKHIEAVFSKAPDAERKIWHRHPVWFIDGNPIVGFSRIAGGGGCIRLLFWSGQSFDEPGLPPEPPDTKFKSAGARYTSATEINPKDLTRWLKKSLMRQWDYKNIVKRKGTLLPLRGV